MQRHKEIFTANRPFGKYLEYVLKPDKTKKFPEIHVQCKCDNKKFDIYKRFVFVEIEEETLTEELAMIIIVEALAKHTEQFHQIIIKEHTPIQS